MLCTSFLGAQESREDFLARLSKHAVNDPRALEPDPAGGDRFERLLADVGGVEKFIELLRPGREADLEKMVELYGIRYVEESPLTEADLLKATPTDPFSITDCPTRFAGGLVDAFHVVDNTSVYIDPEGRPRRAFRTLGPIVEGTRDSECQGVVGNLGNNEPGPFPPYDGGHLIGTQFGGWGRRANMAPQNRNFNRGNWLQLENGMASCRLHPPGSIVYTVNVLYDNTTTNVPYAYVSGAIFFPVPAWAFGGGDFVASFANRPGGGVGGTNLRRQVVRQLVASGCGVGRVSMVVDDTGSMSEEIASVSAALSSFIDSGITLENRVWSLLTFKDDVTLRGTTTARTEIKGLVNQLYASGGDDCPEQSLGGLWSAAQALAAAPETDPRDIVLVTDAEAQPGDVNGLIAFAQENDIRISVLLTGNCGIFADARSAAAPAAGKAVSFPSDQLIPAQVLYSALAQETGGNYFYVTSGRTGDYVDALNQIFSSVGGGTGALDSDGDKVPDSSDACPSSDLKPTVTIQTCDSKAPNRLFENGCTIADNVLACATGATNHGGFVSCTSAYLNGLKKDGTLTGQQTGAIQSCAARSSLP